MSNDHFSDKSLNPTSISDLTGVNVSEGMARNLVNNAIRQQASMIKADFAANAGTITSASALSLASISTGDYILLTPSGGSSSITSFGSATEGLSKRARALGTLILRNDTAKLNLPSGGDLTISTGDEIYCRAMGGTVWNVTHKPYTGVPNAIVNAASISGSSASSLLVLTGDTVKKITASDIVPATTKVGSVRQTVMYGPVTSAGLPNFAGSTGSTTVTITGTIYVTAAFGANTSGQLDLVGSKASASWTSLSTNGTMYLYVDVNSDGTLTEGSTTLAPVYQFGGTPSTTSGQFTFNISEMTGYVGNGATAPQTYRCFVGEVTVAANVVSAITWYALQGKYIGAWTATLAGTNTLVSATHNLGTFPLGTTHFEIQNTTTDAGYTVGDIVVNPGVRVSSTALGSPLAVSKTAYIIKHRTGSNAAYRIVGVSAGTETDLTAASWQYRYVVNRGW